MPIFFRKSALVFVASPYLFQNHCLMGIYYYPRQPTSCELPPIRANLTPKQKKIENLKFIDKVKQSVYIGDFKGAELNNGIHFVLRSLLRCV